MWLQTANPFKYTCFCNIEHESFSFFHKRFLIVSVFDGITYSHHFLPISKPNTRKISLIDFPFVRSKLSLFLKTKNTKWQKKCKKNIQKSNQWDLISRISQLLYVQLFYLENLTRRRTKKMEKKTSKEKNFNWNCQQ